MSGFLLIGGPVLLEWQLNFLCKTRKFSKSPERSFRPYMNMKSILCFVIVTKKTWLRSWETSPRLAKLSECLSRTPCIPLLISLHWAGTHPARDLPYLRSNCSSCLCWGNLGAGSASDKLLLYTTGMKSSLTKPSKKDLKPKVQTSLK